MTPILEVLYHEYNDLTKKLEKLKDLILSYGGQIPLTIDPKTVIAIMPEEVNYPFWETWKNKILFVLQFSQKPVTVRELTALVKHHESKVSEEDRKNHSIPMPEDKHLIKTITQYASAMGRNKELGVDNSESRNKYYLL